MSDIFGEMMLKVLTGEASKGYKKKHTKKNDIKLCTNMHDWRGFIMTSNFKFTFMPVKEHFTATKQL